MELREKIVRAVMARSDDWDGSIYSYEAGELADAILAIPEIAEALICHARAHSCYVMVEGFDATSEPPTASQPRL